MTTSSPGGLGRSLSIVPGVPGTSAGLPGEAPLAAPPAGVRLSAVHPNPFGGAARFALAIAEPQEVKVALHDAAGRVAAVLHDGWLAAGVTHVFDLHGHGLASGTYFVRATGDDFATASRKTIVVR
jgi:hypothetical protein